MSIARIGILLAYGFILLLMGSCEEVIAVENPETEVRLVINGIVRVNLEEEFVPIEIKVTESSNFFENNTITQLESAVILVGQRDPENPFNRNFGTSVLTEKATGTGVYVPSYIPGTDTDDRIKTEFLNADTEFFLIIEHKGRRYAGQTWFVPTVPIDQIAQGEKTLFDENETEIVVTFTDLPDQKNYYIFDFGSGNFLTTDDQFINGQSFSFSYFYDQQFEANTQLSISLLGADQQFFNYMNLLIEQTENNGGVFQTPAATVRGNMFDVTGLDNIEIFDNAARPESFPLGYFAIIQEQRATITLQ